MLFVSFPEFPLRTSASSVLKGAWLFSASGEPRYGQRPKLARRLLIFAESFSGQRHWSRFAPANEPAGMHGKGIEAKAEEDDA